MRLDLALIRRYPELSRRKAQDVIQKGQVTMNGQMVREPGQSVDEKALVEWNPHKKVLPRARMSLPLLHEDDSILIVDKPAGLLTVPTSSEAEEDTVMARVREYASHLKPPRRFTGAAHRLDRDTSGAVAFALDHKTHQALRALFREHRIERRYATLVEGAPKSSSGVVELPIHDAYEAGKRRVAQAGEPSLPAVTRWRVLDRFPGAALLEVTLETGRQHQIRLHLAHVGLPILGDHVYGRPGRPRLRVERQMLHARFLSFIHPWTGARIEVESPLPPDFQHVVAALRAGYSGKP